MGGNAQQESGTVWIRCLNGARSGASKMTKTENVSPITLNSSVAGEGGAGVQLRCCISVSVGTAAPLSHQVDELEPFAQNCR